MADDEMIPLLDSLVHVLNGLHPVSLPTASVGPAALGGIFGRWEEVVGEQVAAHVQPLKFDGRVLVVSVDDPAWATQLRFLETTMRERLLEVAGARVDEIEVRVSRPGGGGRARRVENTSPQQ